MSDKQNALEVLYIARRLLGAFHRIRTSLEKTKHLDAVEIAKVLIRSRDEIRMAVELPTIDRKPDTGISKESLLLWTEQLLRSVLGLINTIEDSTSFSVNAHREATEVENKTLISVGYAIDCMLTSATFDAAVAPTVQ